MLSLHFCQYHQSFIGHSPFFHSRWKTLHNSFPVHDGHLELTDTRTRLPTLNSLVLNLQLLDYIERAAVSTTSTTRYSSTKTYHIRSNIIIPSQCLQAEWQSVAVRIESRSSDTVQSQTTPQHTQCAFWWNVTRLSYYLATDAVRTVDAETPSCWMKATGNKTLSVDLDVARTHAARCLL